MSVNEYFYWLQGFFELSNYVEFLTDEQIDCVLRHDRLVAETTDGKRGEQMIKIAVLLQGIKEGLVDRGKGTAEIRRLVAVQFQHVIDPKAGGPEEQEKFNKIHMGSGMTGAVYRC